MNLESKQAEINNFCTISNNVTLQSCSSQSPNCPAENVLLPEQKVVKINFILYICCTIFLK